jgi:hypothetical protein
MTITFCLGNLSDTNIASSARFVIHHDGLTQ